MFTWLQDFPEDEPYVVIDGLKWTAHELYRLIGSVTQELSTFLANYR